MGAGSPLGPGHQDEGGELITEINVTPMVDVMLVLLIIFMVTATFIARSSIKVELPKASKAEPVVQSTVGLTLEADGGLLLNDRSIGERELYANLRRMVRVKRDLQVIIAGDAVVPHGRVVRAIDILRRAGVTKFAINVQVDEEALEDLVPR
jgi:biopolymer transport protein ExbD